MKTMARAGVAWRAPVMFAAVTERAIGNQLPGWTGSAGNTPNIPAPYPATQAPVGGNVGNYDGFSGPDPSRSKTQPERHQYIAPEQESDRRFGIIGWNDQRQIRDRHAYWDRGTQRFHGPLDGTVQNIGSNPQLDGPARPDLRVVNISINPQIGSDASRNQDDLTRPYTWLGQQDGTIQPVYGGVPGLYIPYGSRGGVPYPIVDPTNGQGGITQVKSGPPHGLHSETYPDGKLIADRYKSVPQQRPGRFDRPDNSRIAGQSYSQTVQTQAMTGQQSAAPAKTRMGLSLHLGTGGRGGWAGDS